MIVIPDVPLERFLVLAFASEVFGFGEHLGRIRPVRRGDGQ
jgi:hypothetical protein